MLLPQFIIIGERRAGTSNLSAKLQQHPQVFMHPNRDRGYFLDDYVRRPISDEDKTDWATTHSLEDYAHFFEAGGASVDKICGEKSADYLFHEECYERLEMLSPSCKFIVTIRNPINRAWSHYWNEVGKGREVLRFETALAQWPKRKQDPYTRNHLSYIERGFYDETLPKFFEAVGKENVYVSILERLISSPEEELKNIATFLNIDPEFQYEDKPEQRNTNILPVPRNWTIENPLSLHIRRYSAIVDKILTKTVKNKKQRRRFQLFMKYPFYKPFEPVKMTDDTRKKLQTTFAPHVASLRSLLNDDLNEWNKDF